MAVSPVVDASTNIATLTARTLEAKAGSLEPSWQDPITYAWP